MRNGIVAAAGVAAAAAAALAVYHRLSGARLLSDVADEIRLRHTGFDGLVGAFLSNADRADLVVSLTTTPSRIDRLGLTLKSLLRQRRRPAEIRLNVPVWSVRERRPYPLPGWLADCPAVRVVRCDDHGPVTKLLPTAREAAADDRIVVVDDDRIFGERFVEELDDRSRAHPDAIVAVSGWRIPPDLTDRPTTLAARRAGALHVPLLGTRVRAPVEVDVVQALHGYCVRPRCLDLGRLADYAGAPPQAFFCDDVWISAHACVPKLVVPVCRISVTPVADAAFYKRTSLARAVNSGADVERRSNTVMIRHFAGVWSRAARDR